MIDAEEARNLLRRHGWLSRTTTDFREAVLLKSQFRRLPAGETLFLAGEEPRGLYGLSTGALGAFIAPDDMLPVFAHFFQPGSWFGEIPALTGRHHVVGLQTTRETALLHLPMHALNELLSARPQYWKFLGQLAAEHVEVAVGVVGDLMRRDNKQRFIALLMRLAGCRTSTGAHWTPLEVDISQEDLATISNLARTTVNGILTQLEDERLIERSYRRIRIADQDALRALIRD